MCVVTVDRAFASQVDGSTIMRISIFGIARDCTIVSLNPNRPNESGVHVTVTRLVDGEPDLSQRETNSAIITSEFPGNLHNWWFYTKIVTPIPCGSEIQVRAFCVLDPTCFDEQTFTINCDCPSATLTSSVASACNGDGTRTATFSVDLANLPADRPVVGTLRLGSGVPGSAMLLVLFDPTDPGPEWSAQDDGFTGTFPFDYQPGTYDDVVIEISFPGSCRATVPLTDGPLEIGDCPATNCPNDSDVAIEVTDADNPAVPVPVAPDDPCLPAGIYIVTVTEPSPTAGRDYTWFVDGQEAGGLNDNGLNRNSFRHTIVAGSSPSVSVVIRTPNCEPARSEPIILRACGTPSLDPTPPALPDPSTVPDLPAQPTPLAIDWCLVWFWINIPLMIITGIVVLVALCMVNVTLLVVSLVLIVITLISYISWLVACASGRTDICNLIWILQGVLSVLILFSVLFALVLAVAQSWGCVAGELVDVAWFGTLSAIAWWAGYIMGCRLVEAN